MCEDVTQRKEDGGKCAERLTVLGYLSLAIAAGEAKRGVLQGTENLRVGGGAVSQSGIG